MKKGIKIVGIILGVAILIVAGIGGKLYMDEKKMQDEMKEIVYSKEAKKVYKETIKSVDPNAFSEKGVIQSFKVDDKSIKHNPMGGIILQLIVNNDEKLYIHVTLGKENGKLKNSSGGESVPLEELIDKENN